MFFLDVILGAFIVFLLIELAATLMGVDQSSHTTPPPENVHRPRRKHD